jgi:hypothetical protein
MTREKGTFDGMKLVRETEVLGGNLTWNSTETVEIRNRSLTT